MRDVELKYDIIDKQVYALIQALKSFRMYVLHSPITAYVPNRWITQILEFDITIKTAKLLAESNCKVLGINSILEIQGKNTQEHFVLAEGENPQEPLPS